MAGDYLPLALSVLRLHQPAPVDVWNANGVLLLSKGQSVDSVDQLRKLVVHRPMVRESDFSALKPEIRTSLLRAGTQRPEPPQGMIARHESAELQFTRLLDEPASSWLDLHARLMLLLHKGGLSEDFASRLHWIEEVALRLLNARSDESLFILVQLLLDRQTAYGATHALMSASVCQLIAPLSDIPMAEHRSLFRAALTMNIGMGRLQDILSTQKQALDDFQRREIAAHPEQGVAILSQLGVKDTNWLQLVLDHHENPEGDGYPAGKTELPSAQRLLHMADLFAARISPRRTRPGLSPNEVVRNLYLSEQEHATQFGSLLVKCLGLFPPGCYVRLANDEVAVVVRRGQKVNTPLVLAIVNAKGMPLSLPALRDTERTPYAIRGIVQADEVKVRLDPSRVFKRI